MPHRYSTLPGVAAILSLSASLPASAGDWPAYGGSEGGGHYTSATQIHADNVADLELAWTHRSGDFVGGSPDMNEDQTLEGNLNRPTSFMVTPIKVEGSLYYCTPYNRVFALDPASGEERWSFDPGVDMSQEGITN